MLAKTASAIALLLITLASATPLFALPLVRGTVSDAASGENLPLASIRIEGTYRGTIANEAGEFALEVGELPVTLRVTYIGYQSADITLAEVPSDTVIVTLTPAPVLLDEFVVTAEDPAVRIMREVIRRKREWRPRILSYRVQAYSRRVLESSDTIALIGESASEIYWDQEEGFREVIVSRRVTANMEDDNFAFGSTQDFINLYDDDIEILGSRTVGPTHPDALRHYDFELVDHRRMDDKTVFEISVTPKSRLQTAFVGRVSVLDRDFGVLEAEFSPVETITRSIPVPIIEDLDITYKQQFRPFADGVWLPVDFGYELGIEIGTVGLHFPRITLTGLSRLTDYDVNAAPPSPAADKKAETQERTTSNRPVAMESSAVKVELVTEANRVRIDSQAVAADSLFTRLEDRIPLSIREREAYATIDSTTDHSDAFRPTGFLARFVTDDEEQKAKRRKADDTAKARSADERSTAAGWAARLTDLQPEVWFNRVEAFHLGLKAERTLPAGLVTSLTAGYLTGAERWFHIAALRRAWGENESRWIELISLRGTQTRYVSDNYGPTSTSLLPLLGFSDYFDYFWSRGTRVETGFRVSRFKSQITLGLADERHTSMAKSTDSNILSRSQTHRANPPVDEGHLRAMKLTLRLGQPPRAFGVTANRGAAVEIEHAADRLGGDFSFTRYRLALDWHARTLFRRRLAPNALDLRLVAATATGEPPVQRFASLDAALGPFTPFGAFRTLRNRPYEGERHIALFWEHNFRTVPFEIAGWSSLVHRGFGVVLHGASGRTWIDSERRESLGYEPHYTDSLHHELGCSLILYHLVRLDLTRRLDDPTWSVGLSAARFSF